MKSLQITIIVAILLILFFFSGCAEKPEPATDTPSTDIQANQSSKQGSTYKTALFKATASLDPALVQTEYGVVLMHQLFDGLVKFGPYLQIKPALAKTWTIAENGTQYRFILQENARFHNGQPVTADDAVFSIQRLLRTEPPPVVLPHLLKIKGAEDYQKGNQETLTGLEAVDSLTLLITLEAPHAPFLTALGMYPAKIVPKEEVLRLGTQFGQQPVGSGPFQFESWEKERLIRLTRFSDYYDGPAYLDEIHYRIYPGDQYETAVTDFEKGDLDELPVFGDQVRDKLSGQENLQWFHRPSLSLFFYGFNCEHPLLKNPKVRRALSMVIDRHRLVDEVFGGQFAIAKAILPPGMPSYQPIDHIGPGGIDEARQLIKKALGNDPLPIQLEIVSAFQTPRVEKEMALITEFWKPLGITVTPKYITDWPQYESYIASDAVQVYRYAWFADMPDPDSFFYPLFSSASTVNFMQFKSREIDQQLTAARELTDPLGRGKMYRQLEDRIMALSPLAPLFYLSVDRVYQSHVQGAQPSALGAHTMPLHRVWLKKSD